MEYFFIEQGMKVTRIHIDEAPAVQFALNGKIMFTSEKSELIHLTLKPGEQISLHTQPFDVIFYVLSGKGILKTSEGNEEGTENTSIFVPAGLPRGWKNGNDIDLKILVFKDLA